MECSNEMEPDSKTRWISCVVIEILGKSLQLNDDQKGVINAYKIFLCLRQKPLKLCDEVD